MQVYSVYCTLYTVHCTLHCTLYTVHCTLYTVGRGRDKYCAISDPGWFGLERTFCDGKYTFYVIVNFGKFFVYVYILQKYVLHMGLYNVQDVNISNQ